MNNQIESSRCWFCVFNNPQKQFGEMEPEEMVQKAINLWMTKEARGCAINYEIGDNGTPHMHMVLYDPSKTRFKAVQKLFPSIHIEPMHGTKKQALDYIEKQGNFAEKAHTIVIPAKYAGNIMDNQGKRTDLTVVHEMIEAGMKPDEIFDENILYRKYEKIIRQAYFRKRTLETPPFRAISVIYHTGEAGSGKSHTYLSLVEQYGEDNIYLVSDYENGGMDNYFGEHILFLDEYKGNLPFGKFLQWLDGYKIQIHARYANSYALWDVVHITSVFPPEEVYSFMVEEGKRSRDSIKQLLRRINTVVYHYKQNGEFKTFSLPASEYIDYEDLKQRALADKDGFIDVTDEELPFD